MNLVLNMDINATNRKLRDYQKANGIKVDKNIEDAKSKAALKKAREEGSADPSGLIQGLKKIVAPPPVAEYDPFEDLPKSYDYFMLKEEYQDVWKPGKQSVALRAGGYDFMVSVLLSGETFIRYADNATGACGRVTPVRICRTRCVPGRRKGRAQPHISQI